MATIVVHCFQCGEVMEFSGSIGRRDECPKCGADVHSCRNCEFYDATAYNECREPSSDPVKEKDRANFCDFFQARGGGRAKGVRSSKDDLLAAAEALFKKKS